MARRLECNKLRSAGGSDLDPSYFFLSHIRNLLCGVPKRHSVPTFFFGPRDPSIQPPASLARILGAFDASINLHLLSGHIGLFLLSLLILYLYLPPQLPHAHSPVPTSASRPGKAQRSNGPPAFGGTSSHPSRPQRTHNNLGGDSFPFRVELPSWSCGFDGRGTALVLGVKPIGERIPPMVTLISVGISTRYVWRYHEIISARLNGIARDDAGINTNERDNIRSISRGRIDTDYDRTLATGRRR